jgi:hypothetical protein
MISSFNIIIRLFVIITLSLIIVNLFCPLGVLSHKNYTNSDFNVSEDDLKPKESPSEYREKRDNILFKQLVKQKMTFPKQHIDGTVLTDGFNADLPDNAKWENGVIVVGKHVAADIKKNITNPK